MGGFDIWVAADRAILNPTSASLGSLITNPALTTICINNVDVVGSCAPLTSPNRPGVVEVTTIEDSGLNDCNTPSGPCSGLAFTITYNVVSAAASASIFYPSSLFCAPSSVASNPNACVLVDDAQGNQVLVNVQTVT